MESSATSMLVSLASFRTQSLSALFAATDNGSSSFAEILGNAQSSAADTLSGGRNTALRDPEAAYRMMTEINRRDVHYKAQYSELGAMESALPQLQQAVAGLGQSGDTAQAVAGVQAFADAYNAWVQHFRPEVQGNGVLADARAADIALYELEQSASNRFVGAYQGIHGLAELGIRIDPNSHQMQVDASRLTSALDRQPDAARATLGEFAANFARSAELLAAPGNFVQNRLDNLDRAIHYIDGNIAAWRQEFGSGDRPTSDAQTASALAAYQAATRAAA